MRERVGELRELAAGALEETDDVVLLGMGGSSLAPEVLRGAFERGRFHVLDTTHPKAIRRLADSLDLKRTLFVAASKSGTTLETRSHLEYFWERAGKRGGQFAAITDPGSELEHWPATETSAASSRESRRSAGATRRSRRSVSFRLR